MSLSSWLSQYQQPSTRDTISGWLPAFLTGKDGSKASAAGSTAIIALLQQLLSPSLPPWLHTACSACRIIALLILAPILLVGLVDFAEYAVVRTLGLRRRKIRVKRHIDAREQRGFKLSPAQMSNAAPAPLLTPGAYDAETLLRHRARSASSASMEAIQEWQRTGGSFARVSEVRLAASGLGTPEEELRSPSLARASIGVDGAMGFSESEAEDSGTESREGSPPVMRKGLKGGQLYFTPVTPTSNNKNGGGLGLRQVAAASAADLEPSVDIPHHTV